MVIKLNNKLDMGPPWPWGHLYPLTHNLPHTPFFWLMVHMMWADAKLTRNIYLFQLWSKMCFNQSNSTK